VYPGAKRPAVGRTGGTDIWQFEFRFLSHNSLSEFKAHCSDEGIALDVGRIYNPARPESGPFYGLTQRQLSTQDLAEEFGISDQAVTERLRWAIVALVDNSHIAALEEAEELEQS